MPKRSILVNVLVHKGHRLFPISRGAWGIVRHAFRYLAKKNVDIRLVTGLDRKVTNCDVLIVSSRAFCEVLGGNGSFIDEKTSDMLSSFARKTIVVWSDERDSAGNLDPVAIGIAHRYWKKQIYRDPSNYLIQNYNGRLYSDEYRKRFGLVDEEPEVSPLPLPGDLRKLRLSWNIGYYPILQQHRAPFHALATYLKNKVFRYPVEFDTAWRSPSLARRTEIFAAFNTSYPPTIGWQRRKALEILSRGNSGHTLIGGRWSFSDYWEQLCHAKVAISCFGWGEVCKREFEATIAGAAVVMPKMSHLDTWPNIYEEWGTYAPVEWDLSDLEQALDRLLSRNKERIEMVERAQAVLRRAYSISEECEIVSRLSALIADAALG